MNEYCEGRTKRKKKHARRRIKEDLGDDLHSSSGVAFELLLFLNNGATIAAKSDKHSAARIIGLGGASV